LNAIGLGAAVIGQSDPEAVIAVFTADHIIEPPGRFREIVAHGFRLAERHANMLVTFGITPTTAATSYGYLQLGSPIDESARVVQQFKEKPDLATARTYLDAGAECYLWNSGMFVWRLQPCSIASGVMRQRIRPVWRKSAALGPLPKKTMCWRRSFLR